MGDRLSGRSGEPPEKDEVTSTTTGSRLVERFGAGYPINEGATELKQGGQVMGGNCKHQDSKR